MLMAQTREGVKEARTPVLSVKREGPSAGLLRAATRAGHGEGRANLSRMDRAMTKTPKGSLHRVTSRMAGVSVCSATGAPEGQRQTG